MPLVDYPKLFLTADNFRNNGQVDEAIKYYLEIATLATQPAELEQKARALHMAGVSAKENVASADSAYYRDAINFYSQAEIAFKNLGDKGGLGSLYRDWAIINDYAGRTSEARDWFQKSIGVFKTIDDPAGLGITYDKFGLHFAKLGDLVAAENYINQALKLLRQEANAGFFTATTLFDLARVKFKQQQFEIAVDLAEESLSWFAADHGERQYVRRLAQLNGFLSLAYYEIAETKKAQTAAGTYKKLLKMLDPQAAKVLEKDLEELAK
ncbi:MAG TPA: tetratricopeptide repeat protein [Candidatus Saccharimonadales bacterium]|nr:tetratricopeptide repeat protein [Candidatus Saccharimonadales bacterium]